MNSVHTTEPKDWLLSGLMDDVFGLDDEKRDGYFHLTVLSGGLVVTGTAIPMSVWLDMFEERLQEGSDREELADEARGEPDEAVEAKGDDEERKARQYLHLRDAIIHTGKTAFKTNLWRGSLVDVTGWTLGRYTVEE